MLHPSLMAFFWGGTLFDVDLTQLGEEGFKDWHGNDISYILLSSGLARLQNVSSVPK